MADDKRKPREWVEKTNPDQRIPVLLRAVGSQHASRLPMPATRGELDVLLAQEQVNATEELSDAMKSVEDRVGAGMVDLAGTLGTTGDNMISSVGTLIASLKTSREALCRSIDKASASSTRIGTRIAGLTGVIAFAAIVGVVDIVVRLLK
jgi:hypothetical protein